MVLNKVILGEVVVIVMIDGLKDGSSSIYIPLAANEKALPTIPS